MGDAQLRDGFKLTPEVRAELLDPEGWKDALEVYAGITRMAVALVGMNGQMLGVCHNPQPIWSLARAARPKWGKSCPFCLESNRRCTAIADAMQTNSIKLAHDSAGFTHVAAPLSLGGQLLGTLIAGQVFDRYPESIPLERTAKEFSLSPTHLWHLARQQTPTGRQAIVTSGDLLLTLGQAFVEKRYAAILRRRLIESNKDLEHFAHLASHDLQEPLRMITNFMELVQRDCSAELSEKARGWVGYAIDGANRMRQMIDGLLQLSQVGQAPLHDVDVNVVLQEVMTDLQLCINASGAAIHVSSLPMVRGNKQQLSNVFLNLLSNAIKYRDQSRPLEINVSALVVGRDWVFTVEDNGTGIDDAAAVQAFKMFKRLRTDVPGTGIGLALCQRIVEHHNGRIWVVSQPGVGSKFLFTIPIFVDKAPQDEQAAVA